jgi:hypothetical protein
MATGISMSSSVAFSGRDSNERRPLSPRELRCAETLAEGGSLADCAARCGRSIRTIQRWAKLPAVQAAVKELAREHVSRARGVLAAGMVRAARSLVNMAGGESEADSAKVSACRAVLDTAVGLGELADVAERLAALENERGNER